MTNLVKATDETGYRARADRSLQSGRVVSVDRKANVAILDVGMVDNNGAGVFMLDVPFSPQSPPHQNDTVAILRTSSSPYSHVVGGGSQVGGANSGQVVVSGGAVSSIKVTGDTAQQGDVTLDPGTGIDITRSSKTFTAKLKDTAVTPGSYASADITVDQQGRITMAANGSGGGGGAPSTAHYLTSQAEAGLSAEVNLGAQTSGLLKIAVSGGVATPATAVLGTDYAGAPDGSTLETSGATTRVKDAGVTLAKLANIADQTILGNNSGGAAAPLALTAAQVRTLLALVVGTNVQAYSAVLAALASVMSSTATAAAQRTALGLVIGTDVEAHDPDLTTIAGLTPTSDNFMQAKASAWASRTPTQATADLIAVVGDSGSGGTKGLVPAPASGDAAAGKFLKASGAWAVPSGGGVPVEPVASTPGPYTITAADRWILVDATLGGVALTLPLANAVTHFIGIKKVDSSGNTITVSRAGADTIDGATTKVLSTQYESHIFVPDGVAAWWLW